VVPALNMVQEEVDRKLAETLKFEADERVRRPASANLELGVPRVDTASASSDSSSQESAFATTPRDDDDKSVERRVAVADDDNLSPRKMAIGRALRHKQQTSIMQRFLNGDTCHYSFTELHTCVWNGLNDTLREQFWVVQCVTPENTSLPTLDALIGAARLPPRVYRAIMADIYRTMPEAAHASRYFINQLYRGLVAHAALRPDIGYVQGMNMIWANIILCIAKPQQQMRVAEHVVRNVLPFYFTTDLVGAAIDAAVLRYYLVRRCGNLERLLRAKFDDVHVLLLKITGSWFSILFVNQMRVSQRKRFWDMIMLRGAVVLFEFTIRLLIYAQKHKWLERHSEWPEFITHVEQRLLAMELLDPVLKTRLPSGRIVLEDFDARRRAATRVVFAELQAETPLVEAGAL
jgi:hypothetical protein